MKTISLDGVTVATVLPFNDDLTIDWKSYDRLLEYCTTPKGINAVFVNGHAGEGATLTSKERVEVIRRTRAFLGDEVPLLTGIIPYSTDDAVAQAKEAQDNGVDVAVLFPMPQFSAGASSDPRYAVHYVDTILDAVDLPVSIFQQAVSSGNGFTTSVLLELVKRDRVIAIKEGSGDITLYEDNWRLLKAAAPNVAVLPSNYHWLFAQVATGADGILSGMASMIPHLLGDLWAASQADSLKSMREVNERLYPIVRTIYGSPPLIDMHTRLKVGLEHMGIIANAKPRPPLLPVPKATAKRVIETVNEAGLKAAA
ncbi:MULTISPECIES: dihydrodipicolinate synthase family protein [unclassified Aurantimonas]|uniref:dihydrodipicolinate synthase family protein n=1 Tax=unclassified Aurantimonas TaxID=2638230 RepID=UPI002E17BC20|nr:MULTISPECIES: dihydrodipicolinate synthase family protein [unclassified Aurantimonas]MEC5293111.1 dihydrodipicolinate synthase family protein [Aurantimonas sp. C2-3-R2]MEC5414180.1 dihydrodipicolinate synthase family protein [Aurantimonas sp. C2-4-R8]